MMRSMSISNAGFAAAGSTAFVQTYPMPNQSALVCASSSLTSLSPFLSFLLPTSMSSALSSPFSLSSSTQYCMLLKDARSVISKISSTPSTFLQKIGVMVRYRSVPAVSQSCTFISFPSGSSMIFCLYQTPIVGVTRSAGSPMYRLKRLVLPTALSPSRRILQRSPSFIGRQYQLHHKHPLTIYILIIIQFSLRARPSVSLSNSADLARVMVILGLISLLPSRQMFSSRMVWMVAQLFFARIWANLKAKEMHSPMASNCTVPCFFRTSFERNTPSLTLELRLIRQTLFSLNLWAWCYINSIKQSLQQSYNPLG